MNWLPYHRTTPIGLDVGTSHIKAVQLRNDGVRRTIKAATVFPRVAQDAALEQAEVKRIVEVLNRQGFSGRECVLAVPPADLMSETLELPPLSSGAPLNQIASVEMGRIHNCDPQTIELAFWPLPAPASARGKEVNSVMAVACATEDAEQMLEACEAEGLRVQALDSSGWALARACAPESIDSDGVSGILDIGWRCARLIVLYEGVIVYERRLADSGIESIHQKLDQREQDNPGVIDHIIREIGLARVDGELRARGSIEAEVQEVLLDHCERMLTQLAASFSYVESNYTNAAARLLQLTGGGAAIPGLASQLAASTELDVNALAPAAVANCPPALLGPCGEPALTQALGLALHGSEDRGQRSEVRGQKAEVRSQKSEVRGQKAEGRSQRSEVRGQRKRV